MFKKYLSIIGLLEMDTLKLNNFVSVAENVTLPVLREIDMDTLYRYPVPKVLNGVCAAKKEIEEDPYDLALLLGRNDYNSSRLWRLNYLIELLQKKVGCDWLGVYRKMRNNQGQAILLKLAYFGEFSRAEFPLTKEFAQHSNNSTVGLTGKAVVVNDVSTYTGPYYTCDGKVSSEFCCPIIGKDGEVLGIIDAEAFEAGFFTHKKLAEIAKVCFDLGNSDLFSRPRR